MNPQIQAALISAAVALAIALVPQLWRWIRPGRLDVELANVATLKQAMGRPGMQLHISIANVGGTPVKVSRIRLVLRREGESFEIKGGGYFPKPNDQWAALLAPFRLKAGDEWSYHLNFTNSAERGDEIEFRSLSRSLEIDIAEKRKVADANGVKTLVEGSPEYWEPLVKQFDRNFKWKPGEYHATLYVDAGAKRASCARSFRFTIYESDTAEMSVSGDYKYGFGVYVKHPVKRGAVDVDLVTA